MAITPNASGNDLALDVAGGSTADGAGLIQWYGHFGGNQRFDLVDQGDGTGTIVNQNSGKCLTTDGVAGHASYQSTSNGSPLQQWSGTLRQAFDGATTPANQFTGLRMDIEGGSAWAGARLVGWYPNGGKNQLFRYFQLF